MQSLDNADQNSVNMKRRFGEFVRDTHAFEISAQISNRFILQT